MLMNSGAFNRVVLENRLGQSLDAEILCHRDDETDLVVIRSTDPMAERRLAKNAEYFAQQLLQLCESSTERLQIVEWRESAEMRDNLWRWRFSWVGNCPLAAKAVPVKAGYHKLINGLLSSLSEAAA